MAVRRVIFAKAEAQQIINRAVRFAARRGRVCLLIGVLVPFARVLILPWSPIPSPSIHDEFSYLLAADTFASGRLANPSHPLWQFFETYHVIPHPTYASKYPPGQGLILAAGQKLGHPWIGVLLMGGVMSGVVCWALQGWLPLGLALLGAIIGALRLGISSYWMDSYWGGFLAGTAGALVLGAVARLRLANRRRSWAIFAAGAALLANTRPFEGLVLTLLCAGYLIYISRRRLRDLLRNAALPLLTVGIAAFALMVSYNFHVTGDPFTLPYVLHERMYAVAPAFVLLQPGPAPQYRHDIMREFWATWDVETWEFANKHPVVSWVVSLYWLCDFLFGKAIIGALLLVLPLGRNRRLRAPAVFLGLFVVILVFQKGFLPHYVAPFIVPNLALLAVSVFLVWRWWWLGKIVVTALSILWIAQAFIPSLRPDHDRYALTRFRAERDRLEHDLGSQPGQHLVIVHYSGEHSVHEEWVYNRADIDTARIVWARDMGPENYRLTDYFSSRRVWLLETDVRPLTLRPYPPSPRAPQTPLGRNMTIDGAPRVRSTSPDRRNIQGELW